MKSLQGHLLVASPHLPDPNFLRSVVLIASHDAEHAFGLLLNRPGHKSLSDVWQELTGETGGGAQLLRVGGPLDGPLMVVHTLDEFSDDKIIPGVFLSTQRESVTPLMQVEATPLIPLVGYSGWGAGQLERELEVGGWMTVKATRELVFADPDQQWKLATKQISDEILAGIELGQEPQDPTWN